MKKDLTKQEVQEAYLATRQEPVDIQVQDEATMLISQAINKGVDVATMEKLMSMRRELKAEKAKEEYDRSMADFQAEMPTIEKQTQGYNYKYADLTSIIQQVKDLLAKHGFSYTFDTEEAENKVIIYCKVKHIAGHMEVSKAYITKETTTKMNASQQSGAAMTYGKRYAFVNAFGILTGDEDTDAATPKTAEKISPRPSTSGASTYLTDKQRNFIFKLLLDSGKTEQGLKVSLKKQFNKESIKDLTQIEAGLVIEKLLALPKAEVRAEEQTHAEAEEELDYDQIEKDIEENK